MKKIIFTLVFLSVVLAVQAQQQPMFTQFFCNKLVQNPAYTGSRDALSALAIYRNQWVGFDGAPKTLGFSIHSPILKETSGVGLAIMRDKIGINDNFMANLSYAFRIDFEVGRLAMGLNTQLQRHQVLWNESRPISQADEAIPYTDTDLFLVNFGTGIYFDTDHFYVGLSVPQLLENDLDYQSNNTSTGSLSKQRRHYYGMVGGVFDISENVKLRPAAFVKYVSQAPVAVDINLSAVFYETLLFGATYRTGDSFDVIAQVFINNNICIGYAYDFTLTQLNLHHKGTHEILISIDFGLKPNGFDHPRYF